MKTDSRRRLTKVGYAFIASVMALIPLAIPSTASAADGVVIRKVDTSDSSRVALTLLKPPSASANDAITVKENGKTIKDPVIESLAEASVPVGVVIAIDSSNATDAGATP